jgi:predicted nucleic acid-binding Zn ribbon protein
VTGRSRRGGKGTRRVSDVLETVFSKNKLARGARKARPLVAWAEVVGPQLARTTRAVRVQDGVMVIETQDAVAANYLTMQRTRYLELLRAALGSEAPDDLRFQMGAFETPRPKRTERQPPPLSRAEREHAESLVQDASDELRPWVRAAAEALIRARHERERRGFKPCPTCGALTERPGPCLSCRTLMNTPATTHLRSRLIRDPNLALENPENYGLSPEGLECARYLALQYLDGQFETLLLQVVRPPKTRARRPSQPEPEVTEHRLMLESLAQKYLALKLKKPLEDVERRDHSGLPERVKNVLEAGRP